MTFGVAGVIHRKRNPSAYRLSPTFAASFFWPLRPAPGLGRGVAIIFRIGWRFYVPGNVYFFFNPALATLLSSPSLSFPIKSGSDLKI